MGTLYIVATPIGNLEDITIRAIKTLFSVDRIFSEQPLKTGLLFEKISKDWPELATGTKPPISSLNEFEEETKMYDAIHLLEQGGNVAYVSEAGTPLLSDPGFKLVRAASKRNIPIVTIPGASAITAALSIAGLPTDKFLFLGFLPKQSGKKENQLNKLKDSLQNLDVNQFNPTVVLFESPHRVNGTLNSLQTVFGDIEITIARELTKIHEEVLKDTASNLLQHESIKNPKGEFVLLFNLKS